MRSRLPKVAHQVGGRAMLEHVVRAAYAAVAPDASVGGVEEPSADADADDHSPHFSIVVGHERQRVREALRWTPPHGRLDFITQPEQRGTGDAVACAAPTLASGETSPATVLVLYGDTPLIRAVTLTRLLSEHVASGATLTFLTGIAERLTDYGRVIRDGHGNVSAVVEARHATPEQAAITEVNSGIYCFDAAWLWPSLDRLELHANGELYLTDLIALAVEQGRTLSTVSAPLEETLGVNDRIQLADAEHILHQRIVRELMLNGVTIQDPNTTYVESGVSVGQDTILRPGTVLRGTTQIGDNCEIGPNSVIRDSQIGDGCVVIASHIEEAHVESQVSIGPMSHLRPGAHILSGARLGNFAEVKNSTLGTDVQMHHFSYIGDATVGARSNIAAGTITANFAPDGSKSRTEIGAGAFIGCDTILIAPVAIGEGAQTGAGAVVKRDVPPLGVAVGMPARVIHYRQPAGSAVVRDAGPQSGVQASNTSSNAAPSALAPVSHGTSADAEPTAEGADAARTAPADHPPHTTRALSLDSPPRPSGAPDERTGNGGGRE